MTYQSHHYSATLPCSVCLTVFLHTCLLLSVLLPFMLCVPCPFNAPFLFCVFQLLHTASFYTSESLSIITHISSLFCLPQVSVHLVHAICRMILHALPAPLFSTLGFSLPLHIATASLPQSSTHSLCSACSPHVEFSS
jgi:hypothetical protein